MLPEDDIKWGKLYDTYAPLIYGTILQFTEDSRLVEIILCSVFVQLRKNDFFGKCQPPVDLTLVKFARLVTHRKLSEANPSANLFVIH